MQFSVCLVTKKAVELSTLTFSLENTFLQNKSCQNEEILVFCQQNTHTKINLIFLYFTSPHFNFLWESIFHATFLTTERSLAQSKVQTWTCYCIGKGNCTQRLAIKFKKYMCPRDEADHSFCCFLICRDVQSYWPHFYKLSRKIWENTMTVVMMITLRMGFRL